MRVGEIQEGMFVPGRLTDQTVVEITYDLLNALSRANLALGKIDGISTFLPNTEFVSRMFELKDALSVRKIEQEEMSPLEYFEAILSGAEPEEDTLIGNVRNEVQVLHRFYRNEDSQLTLENLKDLAMALYGNYTTESLEYRMEDAGNDNNILTSKFLAKYHPPVGNGLTALIENLFTFLNDDTGQPPAIKAGLIYAQWNFIQPFRARNMSMVRVIITRWLLENGIIRFPAIALSPYFDSHRVEFQFRLLDMLQSDEWSEWITYVILGLEESAKESFEIISAIVELNSMLPATITALSGHEDTAEKLLRLLYNQPLLHIQYAAAKLDVAFGTANSLLNQFEDLGIVTEITGQSRNKRFLFQEYFRLFFPDEV